MRKVALAVILCFITVAAAFAEFKTIGAGPEIKLETSSFSPQQKSAYDLMMTKCSKCHGADRVIIALQTGEAPSGVEFNKEAIEDYAAKMKRKTDSNISNQEIVVIKNLMEFLLVEAVKVK